MSVYVCVTDDQCHNNAANNNKRWMKAMSPSSMTMPTMNMWQEGFYHSPGGTGGVPPGSHNPGGPMTPQPQGPMTPQQGPGGMQSPPQGVYLLWINYKAATLITVRFNRIILELLDVYMAVYVIVLLLFQEDTTFTTMGNSMRWEAPKE